MDKAMDNGTNTASSFAATVLVWFQLWFKSISVLGALARRGATLEDGHVTPGVTFTTGVTTIPPRQATNHPAPYVRPPPNNLLPSLEYIDGRFCNTLFIGCVGGGGKRWGGRSELLSVDVLKYAVKQKLGKLGVGKVCLGTCATGAVANRCQQDTVVSIPSRVTVGAWRGWVGVWVKV